MDGKEEDIRMDLEEKSDKGRENPAVAHHQIDQLCPPLSINLWPNKASDE